jgi:cephalosporin hydroxylase
MGFPISQSWGEIEMLRKYAGEVPPDQCIIDIGTRNGGSAIVLAMSSQSPVYTIDILADPRYSHHIYGYIPPIREHFDSFPFGDRIHIITCVSWEYVHEGPPVGLVFIDGDHTSNGIFRDWHHFYPMVEEGGYILCHDYGAPRFPYVEVFLDGFSDICIDLKETTAVFRKEVRT